MKTEIPVIANCTIDPKDPDSFLVEDLGSYVDAHRNMIFPHKHSFYHFVVFTAGSGSHTIDFKHYPIQAQQAYFMAPGQVHTWNFKGDEQGFIVNFQSDFFQSFLLNTAYLTRFSFLSGQIDDCIIELPEAHFQLICQQLTELIRLKKDDAAPDLLRTMLLATLLYFEQSARKLEISTVPHTYNTTIYHNFRKLVDQEYKEIRLPKDYAELLYITPNHLNAICKDYIGQPAGEIIRARVVLEAQRLLINKKLSISEIASELQFSDNSYFTKFFKKQTGITPEEFRKLNS